MLATMTSKGQVTIPKEIRDRLNLHANDRVDFIYEEGRALLVPVKTLKDLRGAVPSRPGADPAAERAAAKAAVARRQTEESA